MLDEQFSPSRNSLVHFPMPQSPFQEFGFTDVGELQFEEDLCLDVASQRPGAHITILNCHGLGGNQKWIYDNKVSPSPSLIPPPFSCPSLLPLFPSAPYSCSTLSVIFFRNPFFSPLPPPPTHTHTHTHTHSSPHTDPHTTALGQLALSRCW